MTSLLYAPQFRNQQVAGSSPTAGSNLLNNLEGSVGTSFRRSVGTFVPTGLFRLLDGIFLTKVLLHK